MTGHPDDRGLAPVPRWLMALIREPQKPVPPSDTPASIPAGRRNATIASFAGTMRRRGMGVAAIEAALLAENAARCAPPLEPDEVRRIAVSIGRYAPSSSDAVITVEVW